MYRRRLTCAKRHPLRRPRLSPLAAQAARNVPLPMAGAGPFLPPSQRGARMHGHENRHAGLTRRALLGRALAATLALTLPAPLAGCARRGGVGRAAARAPGGFNAPSPEDERRLLSWVGTLRAGGLHRGAAPLGAAAARAGELALGTPYEAFVLEEYLRAGGSPFETEPLRLDLTRFDCVSLVESCLAVARLARAPGEPNWSGFAREIERMRYRGGIRQGYASRLHYFSEWIADGARRGLVEDLGRQLGGVPDHRPLRFMTARPDAYPALAHPAMVQTIAGVERALDASPRWVVPTDRLPAIEPELLSGDVIAFATSIEGLDVTHAAFAYRDAAGVLRVLHAPLSGGVVEVTGGTVTDYVRANRRATGILVARPLPATAPAGA
jgi:hypothetical protein